MSGFPRKQSVRHRLEHLWNGYVQWGVANPDRQKVLKQIQVWGGYIWDQLSDAFFEVVVPPSPLPDC